jgi:CheY-like chemotaxis protein
MSASDRVAGSDLSGLDALVVEDDEISAEIMDGMLRALGVRQPRIAATVHEALLSLRKQRPDVVLLDASLKGLVAHRVVEELTEGSIPFLVVTGYAREALPAAFKGAAMVSKPVDMPTLVNAVLGLLATKRESAAGSSSRPGHTTGG